MMRAKILTNGEIMKKVFAVLVILVFTLSCFNCVPVMVGGLITKSIKSKQEKQEFLANFNQNNLEREKAGLLPLNLCIAKYQFDPRWAKDDKSCSGIIQEYINGSVDEFGQKKK